MDSFDDLLSIHAPGSAVREAERQSLEHIASCEQCRQAPGPPPPDCPPELRDRYACPKGLELHEAAVRAAHEAYGGP